MSVVKMREAYESRQKAIAQMRALDTEIGDEKPTEEQQRSFDAIDADIDKLDIEIQRWMKEIDLEQRTAGFDDFMSRQKDIESGEHGMTGVEKDARRLMIPEGEEGAARSIEFTADSAEVARLARRDITAGTPTDGAELVPTTLWGQLYAHLREEQGSLFNLARVVATQSGEQIDFPVVTAFSSAVLVSEGGAFTESDPQFATVALNAYKYGLMIQISSEFEQDHAVAGAVPWITRQAGDAMRRGAGAHLVTGDGTDKPNGIVNGTNSSVATGVVAPTGDNLIDAYHDVVSGYRGRASWLFNDATMAGIRKLKDGDGQYLWQPGLTAGAPDRILGRPAFTDDSLATVGANAKIGIFGDIEAGYLVRTVAGMTAMRSAHYAMANDLITWTFKMRVDGDIIDNNAFTVITNEAS